MAVKYHLYVEGSRRRYAACDEAAGRFWIELIAPPVRRSTGSQHEANIQTSRTRQTRHTRVQRPWRTQGEKYHLRSPARRGRAETPPDMRALESNRWPGGFEGLNPAPSTLQSLAQAQLEQLLLIAERLITASGRDQAEDVRAELAGRISLFEEMMRTHNYAVSNQDLKETDVIEVATPSESEEDRLSGSLELAKRLIELRRLVPSCHTEDLLQSITRICEVLEHIRRVLGGLNA